MTISKSTFDQVRAEHHTDKYRGRDLIVRRGFPVRLETSSTLLTCRLVPVHPRNAADLGYQFSVSVDEPVNGWSLEPADGHVQLNIPANAVVGLYSVEDGESKIAMSVLFNPFSEEDDVYMEGEEERNEYVLNDVGRIWVGASTSPSSIPWLYAQFRTKVIKCAMHMIDLMTAEDRNDPLKVCRHISAMVNSQDDGGVLAGRWDGKYRNGTSPSAWTGSAAILKEYWRGLQPVRYGQCWVFAGVFTSVMRALGIPCRTITNFVSAHDTTEPYNRAVDMYYDSEGNSIEEKNSDSIWNFHVWNSFWCRRPDLESVAEAYGLDCNGWQVVDATPQELSAGFFQLGPAPLNAIKYGYSFKYDTDFVIGEVNADVVHYWQIEGTNEFEARAKYSRHVGQKISTKAVGRDERNDVTLDYKFPEGSEEERASLKNRSSGEIEPKRQPEELDFEVESSPDVKVGDTVRNAIIAKNDGEAIATVRFTTLSRLTGYTGQPIANLGSTQEDMSVEPGESGESVVEIGPDQYEPHLGSGVQTVQFICAAKVQETGQTWSFETLVRLNADETLTIAAPESVDVGSSSAATAIITNISHMPLTEVRLRVEGEGLTDLTVTEWDTIEPGATVEAEIALEPSEVGDRLLVATLDSAELKDVSRSVHIVVQDS